MEIGELGDLVEIIDGNLRNQFGEQKKEPGSHKETLKKRITMSRKRLQEGDRGDYN